VTARIVGWIRHAEFVRLHAVRDFGYGPLLAVDQAQLHAVSHWACVVADDDVEHLAEQRNAHKRHHGVADRKIDKAADSKQIDRDGACAELAVGRLFGVRVDTALYVGGDVGFDLMTRKGERVAVKATRKPHGRLFFRTWDLFKADLAVLVVVADGPAPVEDAMVPVEQIRW